MLNQVQRRLLSNRSCPANAGCTEAMLCVKSKLTEKRRISGLLIPVLPAESRGQRLDCAFPDISDVVIVASGQVRQLRLIRAPQMLWNAGTFTMIALCTITAAPLLAQTDLSAASQDTPAELIEGGFQFIEGPAVDAAGNLYFTDIPRNQIHKRDVEGKISIFAEPSGHCNGLMVCGNWLLACEMDGRLKMFNLQSAEETILCAEYSGKRFNAPNDLVVDSSGGIYFTDPRFRAPQPLPQGSEAVYYRSASGEVTRLADSLKAPNGIILSPDENTLYLIPSMDSKMWAYPVEAPGKLGVGKIFCELQQAPGEENGGGDGLTIDQAGNLYITSRSGVQVYSPTGEHLRIISLPEQPANVTFGGQDGSTLFITARTGLYQLQVSHAGHVFPGNPAVLDAAAQHQESANKNE